MFKLGGGGGGGLNVWNGTLILSFSETCSLGHGLVAVFSLFWAASGYVTIFFFSSDKGKLREPDLCVCFIILNVLHCWSRQRRKKTLGRYGFHLIDHLGFEAWDNTLSTAWIRSFWISLVLAFTTPTTHTTPHSTHPPTTKSNNATSDCCILNCCYCAVPCPSSSVQFCSDFRPAAYLPSINKPSVAVRVCPCLFELRQVPKMNAAGEYRNYKQ